MLHTICAFHCWMLKDWADIRLSGRWAKKIQWTRASLTCPPLMEALLIDWGKKTSDREDCSLEWNVMCLWCTTSQSVGTWSTRLAEAPSPLIPLKASLSIGLSSSSSLEGKKCHRARMWTPLLAPAVPVVLHQGQLLFSYSQKQITPHPSTIAAWFVPEGNQICIFRGMKTNQLEQLNLFGTLINSKELWDWKVWISYSSE